MKTAIAAAAALLLLVSVPDARAGGDGELSGAEIRAQRYDEGGEPVGEALRVNVLTANDQQQVAVAAYPEGDFLVVWEAREQDGSGFGIFGRRFDSSGGALGDDFQINTYTTGNQRRPHVAIAPSAVALVVWMSGGQDGSNGGIFGQRLVRDGSRLGTEIGINTITQSAQELPDVAAGENGFVVVWENEYAAAPANGISARRFDAAGAAMGTEFPVNLPTDGGSRRATVAVQLDGGFVLVWDSGMRDGSSRGVFGQRYASDDTKLGAEFQVNTATQGNQRAPAIAADAGGGFVVVWVSGGQDGSNAGVFGQRYDEAGVAVGSELQINSYTTSDQSDPDIALLAGGGLVVVWQSFGQDGENDGVFGQRYDAQGNAVGTEFRANVEGPGEQAAAAVAAGGNGFVVVWHTRAHCSGDCNADRLVTVDELVRGVNLALGNETAEACPPIDPDGDDVVTVAELVRAVNTALIGCPA